MVLWLIVSSLVSGLFPNFGATLGGSWLLASRVFFLQIEEFEWSSLKWLSYLAWFEKLCADPGSSLEWFCSWGVTVLVGRGASNYCRSLKVWGTRQGLLTAILFCKIWFLLAGIGWLTCEWLIEPKLFFSDKPLRLLTDVLWFRLCCEPDIREHLDWDSLDIEFLGENPPDELHLFPGASLCCCSLFIFSIVMLNSFVLLAERDCSSRFWSSTLWICWATLKSPLLL